MFPSEAGYALDLNQARYYLMETHYNNPRAADDFSSITMRQKADSSGLNLFYTDKLRKYDAGVLSIGKIIFRPPSCHISPHLPLSRHSEIRNTILGVEDFVVMLSFLNLKSIRRFVIDTADEAVKYNLYTEDLEPKWESVSYSLENCV